MKRKIEESLRRAVEDLPRPDYGRVAQPLVRRMEVHDYITRQDAARRGPRRGVRAASALTLCALALCVGLAVYFQYFRVWSVVDLRVNPAFAISLNRHDQVRGVEALNADAQPLLEGRSYAGWTLEAAVGNLLDALAAEGYLDDSGTNVDVAVSSKSAEHGRALREEVEGYIAERLSELPAPVIASTPAPAPAPSPTPGSTPAVQTPAPPPVTAPAAEPLTEADIEAIILERMPGAVIKKVELDEDDGRPLYEAKFRDGGGTEYEAELDALTGRALRWEADD